jgi:hypothetical protein
VTPNNAGVAAQLLLSSGFFAFDRSQSPFFNGLPSPGSPGAVPAQRFFPKSFQIVFGPASDGDILCGSCHASEWQPLIRVKSSRSS